MQRERARVGGGALFQRSGGGRSSGDDDEGRLRALCSLSRVLARALCRTNAGAPLLQRDRSEKKTKTEKKNVRRAIVGKVFLSIQKKERSSIDEE